MFMFSRKEAVEVVTASTVAGTSDVEGALVVDATEIIADDKKQADEEADVTLTKQENQVIDAIVGAIGPVCMRLGFGGFVGFCSGYAIKKAAKVAAFTLGVGFVCLQSLQYVGYIEIKWGKIRQDMIRGIDSDGSGSIGIKDIRYYVKKVFHILKYHGPPGAGFGLGLYLGLQEG